MFADDTIIYVENLKELTKKPLGTRCYGYTAGHKVKIQKSITIPPPSEILRYTYNQLCVRFTW